MSSKFLKLAKMIGVAVLLTLIGCGSGAQRQTSKETAVSPLQQHPKRPCRSLAWRADPSQSISTEGKWFS